MVLYVNPLWGAMLPLIRCRFILDIMRAAGNGVVDLKNQGGYVRRFFSILGIAALCPLATAWGQLEAPNAAGVSFGQVYTIVRDVDATKKFWTTLGGHAIKIDGTDVMKFPGVFIFVTKGTPSAGSYGSVVNHVKFLVPDVDASVKMWKAAGVTAEAVISEYGHNPIGWAYTPDNLKIRFNPDKKMTIPIGRPGVQLWTTKSSVPQMQAWYVKTFGGKLGGARKQWRGRYRNSRRSNHGYKFRRTTSGTHSARCGIHKRQNGGPGFCEQAAASEFEPTHQGTDSGPYRL